MAKNETAIATIEERFPILSGDSKMAELIRLNTGGQGLTMGDLTRITVPAGGGTFWEVPSLSGAKAVEALEGCVIHQAPQRAYWKSSVPSNDPPDCSSTNMISGTGDPGGECEACPLNQFESATRPDGSAGRGKACSESVQLFLLREGGALPDIVGIPPGSLKVWRGFMLQVAQDGLAFNQLIVRLKLTQQTNKDGTMYAQVEPEFVEALPLESLDKIREFAVSLGDVFKRGGA